VIAEVVRELLTPARRRELHRAIALSLVTITASGESAEVAGDIARHAERSGEQALAYQYALRASEAATARYAFEEALSWLDLASGIAGEGPEADQVNRQHGRGAAAGGLERAPAAGGATLGVGDAIERRDLDLGPVQRAEVEAANWHAAQREGRPLKGRPMPVALGTVSATR